MSLKLKGIWRAQHRYTHTQQYTEEMELTVLDIVIRYIYIPIGRPTRPGKVDSLFPISHFLNFDAGGRSVAQAVGHALF